MTAKPRVACAPDPTTFASPASASPVPLSVVHPLSSLPGYSLQVSSAVRLAALLASTVLSDDANSLLLPADGVHRLTALHSRFGRVPSAPSDGKADHPPQRPSAIADSDLSLDREWLDQTAAATGRLVPEALRIAARHDAHTVRSAVGEAARRLLGTCRRTLPARAAVDLITTLAALRADADVQVRPPGRPAPSEPPDARAVACAGARRGRADELRIRRGAEARDGGRDGAL